MADVLCVGSATVDHFLTVGQPLASIKLGDKILVSSVEIHTGGGATNAAVALSKLGVPSAILTKLGHDHEAAYLVKELQHYRIKNLCAARSSQKTDSSTIISSTYDHDRIIYVHKGASQNLSLRDCPRKSINGKWLYLASVVGTSLETAKKLVSIAHKQGMQVLFNPSLYLAQKGKKALAPLLQKTTILVLNLEEAQALLQKKGTSKQLTPKQLTPKQLLSHLQELGPSTVVITNGEKIVAARDHKQEYTLLPPRVKVVHTAGAGDAFTAGLLAGLIKGYGLTNALQLGQANALSVIQSIGAKSGQLTLTQAKHFIKKYKIKVEGRK